MCKYGLTDNQIQVAKEKIVYQKYYLDNHFIKVDNNYLPYSYFFKNAFINSHRYIAELQNRVWSLYNYAVSKDLVNIFITLTLPSEYHKTKTLKNGKVIKNPKYIDDDEHKPNAANKKLSQMWKSLLNDRSLSSLSKHNRVYFRVTEPHKNGTPHLHISLFVPKLYVQRVISAINRKFPSPQSKVETNIFNPVSYLMKYILKTLDDLRYGEDKYSNLSYWYIANKIPRLFTSRTLISLDVYRVLGGRYTLNELTYMYKNREIVVLLDEKNKPVEIVHNSYTIWQKKHIENPDTKDVNFNKMRVDPIPVFRSKIIDKPIPVIFDYGDYQKKYFYKDDRLISPMKLVSRMKDYKLFNYFSKIDKDIEDINLHHYGVVKNECVQRGLIDGVVLPVNEYNLDFNYEATY